MTTELILIGVVCFLVIITAFTVREMIGGKKNGSLYATTLLSLYKEKSVVDSLKSMLNMYKPNSVEKLAITKAIFYLEHSIMMDYESAFAIINKAMASEEVIIAHNQILENERQKVVFLLEKSNGGNC